MKETEEKMKLPWNKKYLQISFHVILTLAAAYVLLGVITGVFYGLTNMGDVFSGLGKAIGKISDIFFPFILGAVIAYLLDPAIECLQNRYESITGRKRKNTSRRAGTVLLYLIVIIVLVLAGAFLFFRFKDTFGNGSGRSIESITLTISNTAGRFTETFNKFLDNLDAMGLPGFTAELSNIFNTLFDRLMSVINDVGRALVNILTSLGGNLVNILLALAVSFYMLKDKEALLRKINEVMALLLPSRVFLPLKNILGDINAVFSEYIRGQLTDAFIMAVLISGWLLIVKVDFALIIGIFTGLANLIPYIGAFIGFASAVSVALLSGEPMRALYAAIGIIIIQQIDSIYLMPRVVGEKVELSPLLVILSLTVGGKLFGLAGMMLAVPVCAVIKLFLKRWIRNKKIQH